LLLSAKTGQISLIVSEINLGEVYYRCIRRTGKNLAIEIIEQFTLLPIEIAPVDWDLICKASELKAEIPIAYADCFAIATALLKEATVITGDPEFAQASHLISIDWLK
jgi:predicted nucleic acid-binding protein